MGILGRFAELLAYPRPGLLAAVDACLAGMPSLPEREAQAAVRCELLAFRAEAERLGLARLEEAYTAAFDLDPSCSLEIGHHVFGDNPRRGFFMARLVQLYREAGMPAEPGELPDHLPAVLHYLDAARGARRDELLADALVPSLVRLAAALDARHHPYSPVVRALLAELGATT